MQNMRVSAILAALAAVVAAGSSSVTGTVTYGERIALPPDAMIIIRIWDVTRRDDWQMIGKQVLTNAGQPPVRFKVEYNLDRVRPDGDYVVEARILVGSQLRWINTAGCPVLTKGYPAAVSVVVRPFTVGAQSVALTSRPIPDCRYDRR